VTLLASRDPFTANVINLIGGKGSLTFQEDVIQQLQLLDLEQSAFPPWTPIFAGVTQAAVAANFSGCGIGLIDDPLVANKKTDPLRRFVLDSIAFEQTDQTVIFSIGGSGAASASFGVTKTPNGTLKPHLVTTEIGMAQIFDVQAGGIFSAAVVDSTLQFKTTNAPLWTPAYPIAILGPGQFFYIQNFNNVNAVCSVFFTGRLYVGS